ncbi:IF2G [Hepatospora eriocheir]|uniref:IF2G n=2 Tax=Hepatospora eriocheir TaxID=1081669 RepID=A0A1X0QDB6_9MICR|nr:IF2G [Hepatospora eriocheir]
MNVNVDAVLDFIVNYVKEPELNYDEDSKMIIIRSFDINKPGTLYSKVQGGVIGGSIISGSLRVGEEIEIRPGKIIEENGEVKCVPFITEIKSLYAESTNLDIALPGGLIGVGTDIDPSECKNDMMVGSVVGKKGILPPVFKKIKIKYNLLEKPVGSDVDSLDEESVVTVNVSSASSVVNIIEITDDYGYLELLKPICANVGEKLSISIKEGKSIRLVGYGNIIEGEDTEIIYE